MRERIKNEQEVVGMKAAERKKENSRWEENRIFHCTIRNDFSQTRKYQMKWKFLQSLSNLFAGKIYITLSLVYVKKSK